MTPKTRYARSGDVNIAYQVIGEGPVDLVHVPGFVSHLELAWQVPSVAKFFERLSSFCRLIRFDKRGTGMSDRVEGLPTLETRMDDVRAVMDAVGSERAALLGTSEGGPLCILFAATHPERVWALVLSSSFPRVRWAPDYTAGMTDDEVRRDEEETERMWKSEEAMAEFVRAVGISTEEQAAFARYIRYGGSPGAALALTRMNNDIDVRHVLPSIRTPTLVLNREAEHSFNVAGSRYIAEKIPGAQHVELPGS